MIKVSIIVPVYNAGNYLSRCIDTLVNQTLREIEIILVLDCPTDGSDKVCEEYASKDERIKIVRNEENLHIGLSRNKGLDVATGEYVGFSDHDDYRELDMYERLYKRANQENLDMVLGVTVNEENGCRKVFDYPEDLHQEDIRDFALMDLIGGGNYRDDFPLAINIHPHLYKREIIKKNNLRFVDTRLIAPEDRLFNTLFLLYARNVGIERAPLYYHRIIKTSEVHNPSYMSFDKRLNYIDMMYQYLQERNTMILYESQFFTGAQKMIVPGLVNDLLSHRSAVYFSKMLHVVERKTYCRRMFEHYSLGYSKKWWLRQIEKFIVKKLSVE